MRHAESTWNQKSLQPSGTNLAVFSLIKLVVNFLRDTVRLLVQQIAVNVHVSGETLKPRASAALAIGPLSRSQCSFILLGRQH